MVVSESVKRRHTMANQFLVLTDESGNLLDAHFQLNISTALSSVFQVQYVFVYSHGWWTSTETATEDYNRFSIELAAQALSLAPTVTVPPALAVGMHWPSLLSEDPTSVLNYGEALSFYGMANRANAVGAAAGFEIHRTLLNSRQPSTAPLRLHLIGHSLRAALGRIDVRKELGVCVGGRPVAVTGPSCQPPAYSRIQSVVQLLA
jgi:hypothetical protein